MSRLLTKLAVHQHECRNRFPRARYCRIAPQKIVALVVTLCCVYVLLWAHDQLHDKASGMLKCGAGSFMVSTKLSSASAALVVLDSGNMTMIGCCNKCAASKHCTGGFTYEAFDHEEGGKPPTCTLHESGKYVSASVCVGCVSFLKLRGGAENSAVHLHVLEQVRMHNASAVLQARSARPR